LLSITEGKFPLKPDFPVLLFLLCHTMGVTFRQIVSTLVNQKNIQVNDTEARDSLANERTFLAWVRTGFAIAALGIVLPRLNLTTNASSHAKGLTKALSLMYTFTGMLVIVLGMFRYAQVQILLAEKVYPRSGIVLFLLSIVSTISFILTVVLILIT
jgi:putative membrane protein